MFSFPQKSDLSNKKARMREYKYKIKGKMWFVGDTLRLSTHLSTKSQTCVYIDKVLQLVIGKLQVWMRDKKFQITLDLFPNSPRTKSAICLETIADFVYKCVLSLSKMKLRIITCYIMWEPTLLELNHHPIKILDFNDQRVVQTK